MTDSRIDTRGGEDRGIVAHPMDLGFFSVKLCVFQGASFSERKQCAIDLHFGYTNDWWLPGYGYTFSG